MVSPRGLATLTHVKMATSYVNMVNPPSCDPKMATSPSSLSKMHLGNLDRIDVAEAFTKANKYKFTTAESCPRRLCFPNEKCSAILESEDGQDAS